MKSWEEAFDEAEEERKRKDGRKCKGRQTEDAGRERQGKAANGHGGADQQRAKGDGDHFGAGDSKGEGVGSGQASPQQQKGLGEWNAAEDINPPPPRGWLLG